MLSTPGCPLYWIYMTTTWKGQDCFLVGLWRTRWCNTDVWGVSSWWDETWPTGNGGWDEATQVNSSFTWTIPRCGSFLRPFPGVPHTTWTHLLCSQLCLVPAGYDAVTNMECIFSYLTFLTFTGLGLHLLNHLRAAQALLSRGACLRKPPSLWSSEF